jgi:hypothetical protein
MNKPFWEYSVELFYFEGKDSSTILVEWWPHLKHWEAYEIDASEQAMKSIYRTR